MSLLNKVLLVYACVYMYIVSMKKFEHCINLELRKANRVISQLYDSYLHQCGLKTSQFSILRAIHYLKLTTNSQLQDILILDQTTLSRALKPLTRDGLIESRAGEDRRSKELLLTPRGKELYYEAKELWEKAQHAVKKELGSVGLNNLFEVSQSVIALKK